MSPRAGEDTLVPRSRRSFLDATTDSLPRTQPVSLLLVAHVLPDKLPMFRALSRIAEIAGVVPVPYSRDPATAQELERLGIATLDCGLGDLLNPSFGTRILSNLIAESRAPVIVSEVGGYFAAVGNSISKSFGSRFLGVVEDTESGHRRYLEQPRLDFPVVSVARSTLKESEDRLIGESVAFSVERLIRRLGGTLKGRCVGILGYGKIGSSCARAFLARGCEVLIWDVAPIARVRALADGFASPARNSALERPHIIIGASGQSSLSTADLPLLRDWAILASASSKKVEFAIPSVASADPEISIVQRQDMEPVLLAREGTPINFADSAVVGPVLQLVHGEIIAAVSALASGLYSSGLHELSQETRAKIAQIWLDSYVDSRGHINLNFDI